MAQRISLPLRQIDLPLRILCLDGGGVRGLSEIYILNKIMQRIRFIEAKRVGKHVNDVPEPLPCQYFDLICGTSTGGLIALMLGRMRLSVEKCQEFYKSLSQCIFEHENKHSKFRFNTANLEKMIKKVIADAELNENEPLEDIRRNCCKTFVVAKRQHALDAGAALFKSYRIDGTEIDCTILEAARATSAAPTYFEPMTISSMIYVDGGIGFNNPSEEAVREAQVIWPDRPIGCFISIGTGLQDPVDGADKSTQQFGTVGGMAMRNLMPLASAKLTVAEYCADLATSCEVAHLNLAVHNLLRPANGYEKYYRLNVVSGLRDVLLHEWKKASLILQRTDAYVDHPDQRKVFSKFVELLTSEDTLRRAVG